MLVAGTQACRRRLRDVSGRCSFTLPRHCPSWKFKECPRRVGVRSSWLSPRSRLSKLGGPCSNREGPQESCHERQLLRPTSAIRLDAAVTAFRTTHSEESPFVAPEYPPLDIADPHKSQPHALARPSPCLPPSVSTYAALIDWRPPTLRRGANSRAELPHRSADANGDDTGPPLVRPGHRPLLRRLHPAVDIRARAGAGRAEGVQPQGVADQASQGRVGETAPPGAAQGRIGRYVETLPYQLR
jgi:hypothetical protein